MQEHLSLFGLKSPLHSAGKIGTKAGGTSSGDPPQRPSRKGAGAGRARDRAELRWHLPRSLQGHKEPFPVGSIHGLDLGKPVANSPQGAAGDCVWPPGHPDSAAQPCRHLAAAATRGALALQLPEEKQAEQASHPLLPGALGSGTSRQETC